MAFLLLEIDGLAHLGYAYGKEERQLALIEAADIIRSCVGSDGCVAKVESNRFAIGILAAQAADVTVLNALLRRRFQQYASNANRSSICLRSGQAWYRPGMRVGRVRNLVRSTNCYPRLDSPCARIWGTFHGIPDAGTAITPSTHLAIDATYSLGANLSGVGVYSREIMRSLAAMHPGQRFLWCYRPHRYLRSWREPLPVNCRRRLMWESYVPRSTLFHGLNQRLPEDRHGRMVVTFHDLFVLTGEYSTPGVQGPFRPSGTGCGRPCGPDHLCLGIHRGAGS